MSIFSNLVPSAPSTVGATHEIFTFFEIKSAIRSSKATEIIIVDPILANERWRAGVRQNVMSRHAPLIGIRSHAQEWPRFILDESADDGFEEHRRSPERVVAI